MFSVGDPVIDLEWGRLHEEVNTYILVTYIAWGWEGDEVHGCLLVLSIVRAAQASHVIAFLLLTYIWELPQ